MGGIGDGSFGVEWTVVVIVEKGWGWAAWTKISQISKSFIVTTSESLFAILPNVFRLIGIGDEKNPCDRKLKNT